MSVQGHWYFKENTGLGRGFDVLDMTAAPKVPQLEGDRTVNSQSLTDQAISQLEELETSGAQFFLWVHYLDPHAEYVSHAEFDFGSRGRERYDGEIAFTDSHVGRLIERVKSGAKGETTAIVLTSDHGEAFGEHGLYKHGFEVWEELVRVPLIVAIPGVKAKRVKARRSLIDLVPTLLDLFEMKHPEASAPDFLSGQSLVPDLLRGPEEKDPSRIVFVDMSAGPYNQERQAFIENDGKLIASSGRPLGLYDLGQDPGEKDDLLGKAPNSDETVERFKAFRRALKTVHVKKIPR